MDMESLFGFLFAAWATYQFSIMAGYRLWGSTDPFNAAVAGGLTVFPAAMILGERVIWPILRGLLNAVSGSISHAQLKARRKLRQPQPVPADKLDAMLRNGMVFAYEGLVNRDYSFRAERVQKQRIRVDFTVKRNTAIMSPLEREAVRIFETLTAENLLEPATADRLRFALAWGDGRCEVSGGKFHLSDKRAMSDNGMRSFTDVISAEAGHRLVSTQGAVSELYTRAQEAASGVAPSPRVVQLMNRYKVFSQPEITGSDQWS